MLGPKQLSYVRTYVDSLSALLQRLEKMAAFIPDHFAEQIDQEVTDAIAALPGANLPKWSLETFFEYEDDSERRYRRDAIGAYLVRLLARLNEAVRETTVASMTSPLAFPFVKDASVRAIVERDYRELQVALLANVWKGALTLAGSCIEGVLFDLVSQNAPAALSARSAPKEPNLSRWMLGQLVAVCTELSLIPPGVDKLSPGLKDYRNLVHPAVEVREHLTPGEHEARIAAEILNMLHRDLS